MNTTPEHAHKPGIWARARGIVVGQIKRGVSPHQLALTFAVASGLSLFPILGTTTLLCLGAGALLKLNHPLMQLVNYMLAGVQLLMVYPFLRAGEWLGAPHLALSFEQLKARVDAAPLHTLQEFAGIVLGGIGAWAVAVPFWMLLVYGICRPLFTTLSRRRAAVAQPDAA